MVVMSGGRQRRRRRRGELAARRGMHGHASGVCSALTLHDQFIYSLYSEAAAGRLKWRAYAWA